MEHTPRNTESEVRIAVTESTTTKILPLILISITTTIAIVIIALRSYDSTGNLYQIVTNNRDTVGLIVQIVSAALGASQVLVVTALVSFTVRSRMQSGRTLELRMLKLITAITSGSSQALWTSLPAAWLLGLTVVLFTLKAPAALWAGALTPIATEVVRLEGQIPLPTYDASTDLWAWQSSFQKFEDGTVDQNVNCTLVLAKDDLMLGSFATVSTCPTLDLIGGLLGSLSRLSADNSSLLFAHPRIDGSGWTNSGRSYGIGASPGVVAMQGVSTRIAPMLSFDYPENGYKVDVSCTFNETSNYTISESLFAGVTGVGLTQVSGTLPNADVGQIEEYWLTSNPADDNQLAWSTLSNKNRNVLAVAGTGYYKSFDKLQCDVRFEPARYAVHVNMSNNIIAVTPSNDNDSATDIEPTGHFAKSIFYAVEQMSRMSSNNVVSSLGTPLEHNKKLFGGISSANSTKEAILSLESGLETLLDGLLVANAQSQIYILKTTSNAPMSIRYRAIKLGSNKYAIAVLASNCVILLVLIVEALRTRLWKGLMAFNFADVKDVAVAASAGGTSIASRYTRQQTSGFDPDQLPVSLKFGTGQWNLVSSLGDAIGMQRPLLDQSSSYTLLEPLKAQR